MAKHLVIRWLGAFGHGASLREALTWELSQVSREVAAERFALEYGSFINGPLVGLWLAPGSVHRHFRGDVWSVIDGDRLRATRRPASTHSECFCAPHYKGIVIRCAWHELSSRVRKDVVWAAKQFDLPVYCVRWQIKYFIREWSMKDQDYSRRVEFHPTANTSEEWMQFHCETEYVGEITKIAIW